ncbi:hypothetical protein HY970_01915 [Candidatus Kaiserbacteria bacterium]|nr:hypothetical protein [Candidatus Kaiserbacteria bacterium]
MHTFTIDPTTMPMHRAIFYSIIALFAVIFTIVGSMLFGRLPSPKDTTPQVAAVGVISPFIYSFNSTSTLYEAGSMQESTSPYWFVNSGAMMIIKNGIGSTAMGNLELGNKWQLLYAAMNPIDSDQGLHPQNTFRLVSRNSWDNVRLSAAFKIVRDNLSTSSNRNASNGLLFMSRYRDSQTLYYAGVRVDGTAVIKKKYHGTYYTMAQKAIFPGTYDRALLPNLLPHGEWFNLKNETITNADGTVAVRLFMQRAGEPSWTKILETTDDGKKFGNTPPITGSAYVGIRTDFMDVLFDNYRAEIL